MLVCSFPFFVGILEVFYMVWNIALHIWIQYMVRRCDLVQFMGNCISYSFVGIGGLINKDKSFETVTLTFIFWIFWPIFTVILNGQFLIVRWPNNWEGGIQWFDLHRSPCLPKTFLEFVVHVLRYKFESWYIHSLGGCTKYFLSTLNQTGA